jgi:hypothetical protein
VPLYTIEEFASYVQSDVDTATATLLRDLTEGVIGDVAGDTWDASTASVTIKALGLTVAARAYVNPQGWSSMTIDDFTGRRDDAGMGVYLTAEEAAAIGGAYTGSTTAAFTIRPFYDPPESPVESWA